jgi:2-octaprenyl-6-methoxyphenol hydroxylase
MPLGTAGCARHIYAMEQTDIFISGGGVAGLTAAAAFGSAGFHVTIVEPHLPITDAATEGADLRTTAFLQPAVQVLQAAGLWEALLPHATPLQTMRIIDAGRDEPEPRLTRDFDAAEISDQPFGWNLPNWLLRREMVARLTQLPDVDFRPGVGFARMLSRTGQAIVTLTDGTRLTARLVVAADGRTSPVRQAAGITVRTWRYGQKAVTFAVTHPIPHGNVSTEIHRSGGPFTLVPLPDRQGLPCSAVVWMDTGPEIARLEALPDDAFVAEASIRSCQVMGPLTLANRRSTWPIITQLADRMVAERTALIAEAAHVLPPIGAQGLNMSLTDIATLLTLAQKMPGDLGSDAMLDAYHRARHSDITRRVTGIDALNRASIAGSTIARDLRAAGLKALHAAAPVRKVLMRAGLGVR